jgi:hypothetical protein
VCPFWVVTKHGASNCVPCVRYGCCICSLCVRCPCDNIVVHCSGLCVLYEGTLHIHEGYCIFIKHPCHVVTITAALCRAAAHWAAGQWALAGFIEHSAHAENLQYVLSFYASACHCRGQSLSSCWGRVLWGVLVAWQQSLAASVCRGKEPSLLAGMLIEGFYTLMIDTLVSGLVNVWGHSVCLLP